MPGAHDARDPRSAQALAGRHLLLLDDELEPSDVIALITHHFPKLPEPTVAAPASREFGPEVLEWRLTRHSRLHGPMFVPAAVRTELGLPDWANRVFALVTPRDREPAPPPAWFTDADGLNELFPAGLPNREEGRSLDLLIALARRLHIAVRLADEEVDPLALQSPSASQRALDAAAAAPARILTPDPASRVDVYVYSQYWLEPDVLLDTLRAIDSAASEPPPVTDAQLRRVEELIGSDEAAQAAEAVRDGYAVEVPLDNLGPRAGLIEVGVMLEEALPRVVAVDAPGPLVAYQLRWIDTEQRRYEPHPDAELARLKVAAGLRLERLAAEVIRTTSGVAVDESGFLVSPHQLG